MRQLSALALATAALAGAAEAQAQTRDGWRLVNWPAKRDAAAASAAAQPLVMGVPRESRYSPRRSAPTSTRAASAAVIRTPAYEPPVAVAARPTTRSAPTLPAASASTRFEAAPQRLPRPVYAAPAPALARQTPRQPEPAPVQAQASVRAKPEAPLATAAAPVVDPAWTVREELMSRIPPAPVKAQASAPVATAKAEAKAAPKAEPQTKTAAAAMTAPSAAAPAQTPTAEVKTAATAKPAAPLEPWRTRGAENGPRFYSVHRQFGFTPDQTRASAPKGAAADPLPSAFFLAAAPDEREDDTAEHARRDNTSKKDEKKKKPARRK